MESQRKKALPGYGDFESLARKLASVPKEELDREEKKYQAMRKRLKAKKANRKRDR